MLFIENSSNSTFHSIFLCSLLPLEVVLNLNEEQSSKLNIFLFSKLMKRQYFVSSVRFFFSYTHWIVFPETNNRIKNCLQNKRRNAEKNKEKNIIYVEYFYSRFPFFLNFFSFENSAFLIQLSHILTFHNLFNIVRCFSLHNHFFRFFFRIFCYLLDYVVALPSSKRNNRAKKRKQIR